VAPSDAIEHLNAVRPRAWAHAVQQHAADRVGLAVALAVAAVLVGCSGGSSHGQSAATTKAPSPVKIFAAPAGLLGLSPPLANGAMWVLARSGTAANLQVLDLATGSMHGAVPVSNAADALTVLSTGTLVDGTATATTGSLELRNGTSGALMTTVPLSGPVRSVAPGANGNDVYALEATPTTESVAVVDITKGKVTDTIPVSTGTIGVAASVDGSQVYGIQSNGLVRDYEAAGGKAVGVFTVSDAATAAAISPDGTTLFVLKPAGPDSNVAVVKLATEAVTRVLPAPAHAIAVAISPDGSTLYEAVGTPVEGNVQAFRVPAA
jgi:hypothetical protein